MKEMLKVFETNDGSKAVSARELKEKLGVGKDFTHWIKSYLNRLNFIKDVHYFVEYYDYERKLITNIGKYVKPSKTEYILLLSTAIDVVIEQHSCPKKKEVLKYLFSISDNNITLSLEDRRKELKFGDEIIRKLFNGYTVVSQYPVFGGEYRIDWYIEELKLAIEYDESHHSQKSYEDDIRQKRIQEHLKCTFLRYKE